MDFLGRGWSSQEPNHLHGVMSFFPPPASTSVCFPILVFGLLFVSFHVRLDLIMVLLFLCQQFILLPCHLIMCCVNRVLLCCCSLRMIELSGLLTCVAVCLYIGIISQVYALHLGLWRQFSAGLTSADIFVFQTLSNWPCQSICHSCGILYSLFILLCTSTRTQSYLLWPSACSSSLSHSSYSVFLSLSSTCIVYSPSLVGSQLSIILIWRTLFLLLGLQTI